MYWIPGSWPTALPFLGRTNFAFFCTLSTYKLCKGTTDKSKLKDSWVKKKTKQTKTPTKKQAQSSHFYLFLWKNLCDSSQYLQASSMRPKAYLLLLFPQYSFSELFKHRLDQNRSACCHFLDRSWSLKAAVAHTTLHKAGCLFLFCFFFFNYLGLRCCKIFPPLETPQTLCTISNWLHRAELLPFSEFIWFCSSLNWSYLQWYEFFFCKLHIYFIYFSKSICKPTQVCIKGSSFHRQCFGALLSE